MFRITQTGHGFGGTEENCAEFCRKMSYVKVNGEIIDSNWVWRECGDIPLYPQGGTWLIDRTNWCPGMDVWPFDYEVTDYIDFGAENTIDFDMEYYDEQWTQGSNHRPKWVIQSYLITYTDPYFANDAAIDEIIQPSSKDEYLRLNPICGGPVFVLRNNGSEPLTSLKINYGIKDEELAEYIWEGEIDFRDTTHVYLPPFPIPEPGMEGTFVLQLSDPNGEPDEFAADNYAETAYTPVPAYFKQTVMELQTNNYANEQYFYYLRDEHGNVLYSKEVGEFQSNRKYLDTFNLENGCYEFIFGNALGYGLDFWFLREQLGSGYLNLNAHGRALMTFKKDFGNYIYHQFRVITHPRIVTGAEEVNFGKVAVGESATYDFEIMPENEAGIEIESIDIPFGENKGFFIESIEPSLDGGSVFLAEGEKMIVQLKFEPPRDREAKAFMRIFSNDALQSQVSVTLIGNEAEVSVADEIMAGFEISISENPVADAAIINVNSENPIHSKISLFNSVGMKVLNLFSGNTANAGTLTLDASSLPSGAYYLRAVTAAGSKTIPVMIIK